MPMTSRGFASRAELQTCQLGSLGNQTKPATLLVLERWAPMAERVQMSVAGKNHIPGLCNNDVVEWLVFVAEAC